ncbi:MAG: glycosidase [Ilumatobacter sp.]|uniref:glycosidase n=1 Tax=Ilumatobacter sp. TaxID=1967498 RepID=UPI00329711C8
MKSDLPNGVMLNVYPDSIGGRLTGTVTLLEHPALSDVFSMLYVLPSCFHSDLDRGFSIIDYDLDEDMVDADDLAALERLGIALKFDLVLNHLSVGSPQFRDMVALGDASEFRDFFIDWDEFWDGNGTLSDDGHVVPDPQHLERLFMRKPGLPILRVRFPDGTDRNYWNTFYQQVTDGPEGREYLGQMDVNAESAAVWEFYRETIEKLSGYGARILRLDAFAYLHKEVGKTNFFNRPGTWDHLERLRVIAAEFDLTLLPEIHSEYGSGLHEELGDHGYPVYDFFFPGLVIDAIDSGDVTHLVRWIGEILDNDLKVVNMLGCHDGIPVIDLRGGVDVDGVQRPGLLPDSTIEATVERLIERGGRVKNLYGADGTKISYYQVNATFFSALGEDEHRLRLARAIQVFMPGTPEVWYLDLFAGANDDAAADAAGEGGHKEINRTNLSMSDVDAGLARPIVVDQLAMLRLRNTSPAFAGRLEIGATPPDRLLLTWTHDDAIAVLDADLSTGAFTIVDRRGAEESTLRFP